MKRLIAPLLLLVVVLAGCGGESTAGMQGSQALHGPADAPRAGELTYTLPHGEWKTEGAQESSSWSMETISEAIVSNGTVLVYMDDGAGGEVWTALPTSENIKSFDATVSYSYEPGTFSILIMKSTDTQLADALKGRRVRVVVIPPENTAALRNVDASNYPAVAEHFGL